MKDRANLSNAELERLDGNAMESRVRRAALMELGLCICGPFPWSCRRSQIEHGPVVSGGRCQRCLDVKRGTR